MTQNGDHHKGRGDNGRSSYNIPLSEKKPPVDFAVWLNFIEDERTRVQPDEDFTPEIKRELIALARATLLLRQMNPQEIVDPMHSWFLDAFEALMDENGGVPVKRADIQQWLKDNKGPHVKDKKATSILVAMREKNLAMQATPGQGKFWVSYVRCMANE